MAASYIILIVHLVLEKLQSAYASPMSAHYVVVHVGHPSLPDWDINLRLHLALIIFVHKAGEIQPGPPLAC